MGDIRSGDGKEIFKTTEGQAKFENVEVTAQPQLRDMLQCSGWIFDLTACCLPARLKALVH